MAGAFAGVLLLAGVLAPVTGGAAGPGAAGLPERVVVRDSRTSDPSVDIAKVTLESSWYWDSAHLVRVGVPGGMRPGQRFTVWFDIDGDPTPEGRYDLRLRAPKKAGARMLRTDQQLRRGGGWGTSGTRQPLLSCSNEDSPPVWEVRRGEKTLTISFDVFGCFGRHPAGDDPGAWRAVVALARGSLSDSAPSRRAWSRPLRGWGPCDPGGGDC